jgi:hypothetical protein
MKQIFSEFMKKMIILGILQLADLLSVTSELRQKSYLSFLSLFIYSYERVRVKSLSCRPAQGNHAEGEQELQEGQ